MQGLLFPFTILTSTYVAPELMPGWLGTIAEPGTRSPRRSTAMRDLFGNAGWPRGVVGRPSTRSRWRSPGRSLIVAVFLPLSVRRFQRLSR